MTRRLHSTAASASHADATAVSPALAAEDGATAAEYAVFVAAVAAVIAATVFTLGAIIADQFADPALLEALS